MSCFFKRALPKETSLNSVNYLNKFLFFVYYSCTLIYFNDYDIHVNTLFTAFKDGFTVKVKKYLYSSAERTPVDVKRIVTRLALFQFSEGQSRSSNGSHKAINYSGTPLM